MPPEPSKFLAEYAKRQKAKGKQVSEPLLRLLEGGVPEGEASPEEDRAAGGEASLAPLAFQEAQEGAPPGGARVEEPPLSPRASEALQEAQEAGSRFVQRSMRDATRGGL
ncbi:hypothetical protein, partial [Thermus filiformis]|uniref:hypothetical protein n=1 Tax=Thermus filiformis TaxID=276 RepID=UPI00191C2793